MNTTIFSALTTNMILSTHKMLIIINFNEFSLIFITIHEYYVEYIVIANIDDI